MDSKKFSADRRTDHPEVLAGDPFHAAGELRRFLDRLRSAEDAKAEENAPEESPHGCIDGWVYLGFEREEDGELVEIIDRVPCRRCSR